MLQLSRFGDVIVFYMSFMTVVVGILVDGSRGFFMLLITKYVRCDLVGEGHIIIK